MLERADLIDRFVDETYDFVEDDRGLGEVFCDAFGKRRLQVGADFSSGGGFATVIRRVRSKRGDGGRILAGVANKTSRSFRSTKRET